MPISRTDTVQLSDSLNDFHVTTITSYLEDKTTVRLELRRHRGVVASFTMTIDEFDTFRQLVDTTQSTAYQRALRDMNVFRDVDEEIEDERTGW